MDTTTDATTLAALITAAPAGVDQLSLAYTFAGRRLLTASGGTQRQQALKLTVLDYGSTAPAARRYVVTVEAFEADRVRVATGAGSSIANAAAAVPWSSLD
jgi:hypothetical protein